MLKLHINDSNSFKLGTPNIQNYGLNNPLFRGLIIEDAYKNILTFDEESVEYMSERFCIDFLGVYLNVHPK